MSAPPMADGGTGVPRRRAGRPNNAVLDRTHITTAALGIVSERGYPALTMAALARQLGVSPSALYNHASSKQEVLQWVQERVMSGVDSSGFGQEPLREALRRWARSYRDVFAEHAPLIPVVAVLPVAGSPRTLRMYEAVAEGLATAGWHPERIVPAIVALESFIFGSALDAAAPLDILDPGQHASALPVFAGAMRAQRATGAGPADTAFELGLDALLSGLLGPSPAGR